MCHAQAVYMAVTLDAILAGLIIVAFILLGVAAMRIIVRTRKRPR